MEDNTAAATGGEEARRSSIEKRLPAVSESSVDESDLQLSAFLRLPDEIIEQ